MFEGSPHARTFAARLFAFVTAVLVIASIALPDAALAAASPGKTAFRGATVSGDSGESAWSPLEASRMPESLGGHQADLQLDAYQAYRLNRSAISGVLNTAPAAKGGSTPATTTELAIPDPSGALQHFAVYDSPVMEPALAAKYPDIHTYKGVGVDDPTATIRADLTPLGFHASVRSTHGAWYIDPLYHLDQSVYASYTGAALQNGHGAFAERDADGQEISADRGTYHAADTVTLSGSTFAPNSPISITISDPEGNFADRSASAQSDDQGNFTATFVADPDGHLDVHMVSATDGNISAVASYQVVTEEDLSHDPPTGDILRTYRLALITDPGYATFFGDINGATPSVVEAAKVTLINRVDQIYNDDMSIQLTLIANDDQLNLDTWSKATAPNGPCGAAACFTQSQVTGCSSTTRARIVIGQIIGAANYDMGHLALGQPGGGVANLGVVGRSTKAGGCTGIPTPTGDYYAVDYVAHEMGHQFSGNHSYNGTQFNCSTSNRNGATSVEPGSGSSVMAYAGICLTDDLSRHSDPYFSQRSQQEITTYVSGTQAAVNQVQTASLLHFGGGNEVQTVTFGPGFQTALTIQPLSVAIGAANGGAADFTNIGGVSETGNVVTVSTGNVGAATTLTVGDQVTISGVPVAGYNGGPYTVTSTPSSRGFTFTSGTTGLANSGGGSFTLVAPGLTESGNTVTVRTTANNGRSVGDVVVISGAGNSAYNGTWTVASVPSPRSFTYINPTAALPNSGAGTTTFTPGFRINIGGNQSAEIGGSTQAYTNANITSAMNAIAGFGGTATATGAASTGFTVTYTGAAANTDVPNFSIDNLSCNGCYSSVQETTHGGAFDSFTINYNGTDSVVITNGTNYNTTAIAAAITTLTGGTVAVAGFGGGGILNTGFQVTFSGTNANTNLNTLTLTNMTAGSSGWFGVTDKGGNDTRGGIQTPTLNAIPVVNAGAAYTIPYRTPFTLTGSATDADSDPLTYSWEQNDVGPNGSTTGTGLVFNSKVNGPLFAMFPFSSQIDDTCSLTFNCNEEQALSSNPSRTFPDLQQIINNNTDADAGACPTAPIIPPVPQTLVECYSEYLPTSSYLGQGANASPPRLNFRLTARDGKGGDNNGNTTLTLATGTGPFLVTAPNTNVSWDSGSTQTVTWNVAGTDGNGINAANVKISLSTDGGHTYPTVLSASTPNNGSALVTIPNTNSTTARVKVEAVGNIFFDISNADFTINKATSSVGLTSSQNPSVHGQGVSFTATVSSAGGTPTGSVQFAIDGTDFGSPVTLVAGQATSDTTSTLSTTTHNITATYTGDGGFSGSSTDMALVQTVNKADTGTSVVSNSGGTSVYGQGVTFTATVSATAPGAGTPTGTIQFSVDGTDTGSPVALNETGQATSDSISNLSVSATHTIGATYSGDTDFNTSNNTTNQEVDKADTTTAITNGDDLGTDTVVGQSYTVKWSVTANAPGAGTPTGTVTVTGGSGCSASVAAGQCDVTSTEHGSKNLVATYGGDGNFNGSGSDNGPHDVNLADTSTGVTLASGDNPSVHGESVSFTATVTVDSPGAGSPSGSVQFKIDGSDFGSPVTLTSGSATSGATSSLSTAGHSVTAVYSGDLEFNGSTSGSFTQTVNQADTSTALQSSVNPSVHGQSVSFTATVTATAPGAGIPTGLVQFKIDGTDFGSAVSLDGSGQATSGSTSTLSTAGHSITAVYGGDTDFTTSQNGAFTQTVNKAATATTMTGSSANPSVHGQSVTFTAHVASTAPGSGTPTGNVQFKVDGANLGSAVALNGSGDATSPATTTMSTAHHTVNAYYLGSGDFNTSNSATALTQTVNKAATTTTLTDSPDPSRFGNSWTMTATVAAVAPGAGVTAGKVQFYIDGSKFKKAVALSGGHVTITVNVAFTRGTHHIQVKYLGSPNFLASNSSINNHVIN